VCRGDLERLARILDALAHPLRLKIVALLYKYGEMYLAEIASRLGISRALARVHLAKLEKANIVETRVAVIEGKAVARRYYRLKWSTTIILSPKLIAELVERCARGDGRGGEGGDGQGDS